MSKEIKVTETNDFKKLIESGAVYIDKTLFIKEIIDNNDDSVMIPRPRRFGKTLNLSMLYYYFSNEFDSHELFKGLNIMEQDEKYLSEMNKYPTIFLDLKNTKKDTYSEFIDRYKTIMSDLFKKYKFVLENSDIDVDFYNRIINKEEDSELADAFSYLVGYLKDYYHEKVIVILDEYDAPILHGYEKGYYNEIIEFMKQLFVTTFKPEPIYSNIHKGIITGISRISKENLFSDANNIKVYNITDSKFSTYFGFTEDEVINILEENDLKEKISEVKKWYDGYLFNKYTIYNPWSILSFLGNSDHALIPYWGNTGGVHLIKSLIYNLNNRQEILNSYENLLKTGYVEHINLNIKLDLTDLEGDRDNIYTLLMLSGYLTPAEFKPDLKDVKLRIPNLEVKGELESIVKNWFKGPLKGYDFTEYLYNNKLELFKTTFENVVIESFSYYDVPNNNNGENFYHAFAMGLLMSGSSNYEITSNRESGYGRYDLILKPFDKNVTAYIIEFKVSDSDFDNTIEEGFRQIDEMKYEVSLKDYKIVKMVIAFKGKKLKIETR